MMVYGISIYYTMQSLFYLNIFIFYLIVLIALIFSLVTLQQIHPRTSRSSSSFKGRQRLFAST